MEGKHIWGGDREYTLRVVAVTDSGLVVGIAYRSIPVERDGKRWDPEEYFHVVILNDQGSELLNDVDERLRNNFTSTPHQPRSPYPQQLLVDPDNDRVVLRMVEGDGRGGFGTSGWRIYGLSTGRLVDQFDPADRMSNTGNAKWIIDAELVHGTPLILVHWYSKGPDFKIKDAGARFTLADLDARTVWSFDAPNDYAEIDLYKNYLMGGGPADHFRKHPAILRTNEPNRFELRLFATNQRVKFKVEQAADGRWRIWESGREAYAENVEQPTVAAATGTLKYLGEVILGEGQDAASPFGAIGNFTFDKEGDIHFRCRRNGDQWGRRSVNQQGDVLSERWFKEPPYGVSVHWADTASIKDNRFIEIRKTSDEPEQYTAWIVDLVTGAESPFEQYPGGYARSISRFPDGGFVVIPGKGLTCYGPDGAVRWDQSVFETGELYISYPTNVAVLNNQRIALLSFAKVELLDSNGKHLKGIDLKGAFGNTEFGGSPGYLHEVVADADGGFLIRNSRNPPIVLRYNANGGLRSRWSPRHPDGRTFSIRPGIRVAPDGRLWTCDGQRFLRLTDEGVVDFIVGKPPDAERIGKLAGFTVDDEGQWYAVADGTGAVHVFDPSGQLLRVAKPDPKDFSGSVKEAYVAVTPTGEIHVRRPSTKVYLPLDEYLRFKPSGERDAVVSFKPRLAGWSFQPNTGYRCGMCLMKGEDRLMIISPPNKVIGETRKRPNGKWFGHYSVFAMAPDGTMAVLTTENDDTQRRFALDLFTATGEPVRTAAIPQPQTHYSGLAYDGQQAIIVGNNEASVVDLRNGKATRWSLAKPEEAKRSWQAFLVSEGQEPLLFDRFSKRIHRYALPQAQELSGDLARS